MARVYLHPFLVIFLELLSVHGENLEDVQRVLDNHFAPTKYNKMIRGVIDQHKVVEVNVTFNLLSFASVNEIEQTVEVMCVLYIRWVDERLAWDPIDYNDTQVVHAFQNDIWKPEVVMANPANVVSVLGNDRIMTINYYNGTVHWSVGGLFKFYCSLDVTTYPWDSQTCPLKFLVWGYYSNEVRLTTPSYGIEHRYYRENGAWELQSAIATTEDSSVPTVQFIFKIRRFSKFAVVNILIPIIALTVLNLFAFFIPPESGEKLSYCITVLLALAVFLSIVAGHLPGNSNNMASLCYYLMFVLMISTLTCVSSVLSVGFYHMVERGVPPLWLRQTVSKLRCGKRSDGDNQDGLSLKETPNIVFEEFKQYQRDSTETSVDNFDNITWQDVSRCVNMLSCLFAIISLVAATIVLVVFILSK